MLIPPYAISLVFYKSVFSTFLLVVIILFIKLVLISYYVLVA